MDTYVELLLIARHGHIRDRMSALISGRNPRVRIRAVASVGAGVEECARTSFHVLVLFVEPEDGRTAVSFCRWASGEDWSDAARCLVITSAHMNGSRRELYDAGADVCLPWTDDVGDDLPQYVAALLAVGAGDRKPRFEFAGIELLPDGLCVRVAGRMIQFSPAQYRLFAHLVSNNERIVSKDELASMVSPGRDGLLQVGASHGALYECLSQIRKKLGPTRGILRTIRGRGYRVEAPA